MKVILKRRGEEGYLASSNKWTTDLSQAKDFKSFTDLLDYRRKEKIEHVEALFSFDEPENNFIVSVAQQGDQRE